MSDFESDSFPENDWDECGDLVWNEFDWERYLRNRTMCCIVTSGTTSA